MSDETIDLRGYLHALRRWWWLLVAGPVIAGTLTLFLGSNPFQSVAGQGSQETSRIYEAYAVVQSGDLALAGGVPTIVSLQPVLNDVIDDLGLSLTTSQLNDKVTASQINGSSLVQIIVKDTDREMALSTADGVAQSLVDYLTGVKDSQLASSREELSQSLADLELDPAASVAVAEAIASMSASARQPVVVTPVEIIGWEPVSVPGANAPRNLVLGIFLGGVLAVMLAFGLEYSQNPVGSPARLEGKLGLISLGTFPGRSKDKKGLRPVVISEDSPPALVESMRHLATSIGFSMMERGTNIVAIVSPEMGDGRSRFASNLAVALAETWKEVVLVDADLRRPALHRHFEVDNAKGLSSFLSDPDLEVGAILQETSNHRLKVISSGPNPGNPIQLLSSPRMKWLLDHLKETADVVLLDTPPLLAVTDGAIVSSQAEGVVLLVNGPSCRIDRLKAAMSNLEKAGTQLLGYVWVGTAAKLMGGSSRFGQYYQDSGSTVPQQEKPGNGTLKVLVQPHSNGTEVSRRQSPAP